ncbi:MAG: shikimate kinase [Caldilineaceae bacterium]|nr:shikimate kinase [Caldilineaceae bacterium]
MVIQNDPDAGDLSGAAQRVQVIVLTGFMGTGKSTVGQAVAARLGWRFVDSDAEIVARAGLSIPEIFAQQGEPAFRRIEHEVVCALVDGQQLVIATGGGALMGDETRIYVLAHALVICLTASPEAIEARVAGDTERPLLKGDWRALLERRRPVYASFAHQMDTTSRATEELAEEVLALWQNASI